MSDKDRSEFEKRFGRLYTVDDAALIQHQSKMYKIWQVALVYAREADKLVNKSGPFLVGKHTYGYVVYDSRNDEPWQKWDSEGDAQLHADELNSDFIPPERGNEFREALSELVSFVDSEYGQQEVDRNCPRAREALTLPFAKQNGEAERKPREDVVERLAQWHCDNQTQALIKRGGVGWWWKDLSEFTKEEYRVWAKSALAALEGK